MYGIAYTNNRNCTKYSYTQWEPSKSHERLVFLQGFEKERKWTLSVRKAHPKFIKWADQDKGHTCLSELHESQRSYGGKDRSSTNKIKRKAHLRWNH